MRGMLIRGLAPALVLALVFTIPLATAAAGTSILFIGNSFDFASGSAVRYYRADTVTDLNGGGIGGVPALFKSFTTQAGLGYDVSLETSRASASTGTSGTSSASSVSVRGTSS